MNLSYKNIWIIIINDEKDFKVNIDFDSVFNRNIYLSMDYIDKISNCINE